MSAPSSKGVYPLADFREQRTDLAAAFQWLERLDMHEAVANHCSLAVSQDGNRFLINPNQVHFRRITASQLLLIDAQDPDTMQQPNAPDPTAWGLHGAIHRLCPHARCVMHVHSRYATILASLADSYLPPVDQNAAMFFERHVVDEEYGGLAFEEEGERCAHLLADPKTQIMVMGNHGVLAVGADVAQTLHRLYYFERAAATYIGALQTGRELRVMSDSIARKTAQELADYPESAERHLDEVKAILRSEGSTFES